MRPPFPHRGDDHKPARLRRAGKATGGLAAAGALIVSLTGLGVANAATGGPAPQSAVTTLPTVYEQSAINQNVAIAAGNVHTTVATSPVLPIGNYLVNLVISFNNLTAGSQVLCGDGTTASTDSVAGNYGDVENQDSTATTGSCSVTGTVQINNTGDHIIAWATVYAGPAGPSAYSWSINQEHVGKLVVSTTT